MPRINDLRRWLFRRIKSFGDVVEFKVIGKDYYDRRMWYMSDTIRISVYERDCGKRVGVAIKYGNPDLLEFKEFLTFVGAINYIQSKYPHDMYVYYYTKQR